MARKITGGLAGSSTLLGTIQIAPDASLATAADQNITFSPGTNGQVVSNANVQLNAQSDLRFADSDSSNWVAFQAPATISSNITWTLPAIDGSNTQTLSTNGSGTLSWATPGLELTDNTSDSADHFLTLTTATTDTSIAAIRRSSTKLKFQPSTGLLTVTSIQAAGKVNSLRPENVQTASYTLVLSDAGGVINMNNSASATITVPTNTAVPFPIGTIIWFYRGGTGATTIAGDSGVTLSATGNMNTYEELYIRKRDTNQWVVFHVPSSAAPTVSGGSISTSGSFTIHQMTGAGTSYTLSY